MSPVDLLAPAEGLRSTACTDRVRYVNWSFMKPIVKFFLRFCKDMDFQYAGVKNIYIYTRMCVCLCIMPLYFCTVLISSDFSYLWNESRVTTCSGTEIKICNVIMY